MAKPKLKFKINPRKDLSVFYAFINDANFDGGRNLKWAVFNPYPEFKKYWISGKLKVNRRAIADFIKKKYSERKKVMSENLKSYKVNWLKVEKDFYQLSDRLFGGVSWPKGEYTAYLTIWAMYPRSLKDKIFQVPICNRNENRVNVIIAHEMLHFIFYAYFFKKYPHYQQEKYNYFLWQVSEIFNAIIQNSPVWLKVFKVKTNNYPEHQKIIKKLAKKYYKSNWHIDELVDRIIIEVKDDLIL